MFSKETYIERRKGLKDRIDSGILLFPGNEESAMNYPANTFPFRQDSSFLYYWGLDVPGVTGLIDLDSDTEMLFGNDFTVDDIVWMGPQKTMAEMASEVGVARTGSLDDLAKMMETVLAKKREIHFLPPYRGEHILSIESMTGIPTSEIPGRSSDAFIRSVVSQRSVKQDQEVAEIEKALAISLEMNRTGMHLSRPGILEAEVAGAVEGVVLSKGRIVSFPIIFSVRGEVLHGHSHHNIMKKGDLLVLDSGSESPEHYASDITRTFPVDGKFTGAQRDIYEIVLAANKKAIALMAPGVPHRDIHLSAARVITEGLTDLGFMKGNVDDALESGAHAMFFPHGLGHMLGLDVHDMEGLGEDIVGYDEEIKRSDQFGLAYLRLGRRLKPGFVITVEPGIYFMPELIAQWKAKGKCRDFIDYTKAESAVGFGGVRIEDDVLITEDGHRVLGEPIAKEVKDVEAWCKG